MDSDTLLSFLAQRAYFCHTYFLSTDVTVGCIYTGFNHKLTLTTLTGERIAGSKVHGTFQWVSRSQIPLLLKYNKLLKIVVPFPQVSQGLSQPGIFLFWTTRLLGNTCFSLTGLTDITYPYSPFLSNERCCSPSQEYCLLHLHDTRARRHLPGPHVLVEDEVRCRASVSSSTVNDKCL